MRSNPYIYGPEVQGFRFYGRKALIRKLIQPDRKSIWLLGNRRVGKTSLLKHAQEVANREGEFVALYINFESVGASSLAACLRTYTRIYTNSVIALQQAQIDTSDCNDLDFIGFLQALVKKAKARSLKLLLLCDEVEGWLREIESEPFFTQRLRECLSLYSENLKIVISATTRFRKLIDYERTNAFTSPLLLSLNQVYIASLQDDEADELIEQINHPDGKVEVDPKTKKTIKVLTGCHPLLIQKLCYSLFEKDGRFLHNIDTNNLVVDGYLYECFEDDFRSLSKDENRILMTLVGNQRLVPKRQILSITRLPSTHLHTLKTLGFIGERSGEIHILNYFLYKWLKENESRLNEQAKIKAIALKNVVNNYSINQSRIRMILTQYFNEDELSNLCFDLEVEYENLPGETRRRKAEELIQYMKRYGRYNELVEAVLELRPHIIKEFQ